jgi:hypothetical protein
MKFLKSSGILIGLVVLVTIFWPKSKNPSQRGSAVNLPVLQSRDIANTKKDKAPEPATAVVVAKKEWPADFKEIYEINKCWTSLKCNYPQTDPRSYEVAIGKDLAEKIKTYRKHHQNDPSSRALRQKMARDFIKSFDGFVQEAALGLLADLPVSSENLTALVTGLEGTPDATLMKQALPELQRYMGTDQEAQLHSFLSSTIVQGAHFSSEAAAEGIAPFITKDSYSVYNKAKTQMLPGSESLRYLKSALKNHSLLQTGA